MRDNRIASRWSCSVNRRAAGGSSSAPSRRVSAAARIDAAGVFSSWDAFATKSRRTASSLRASVTSRTTTSTDPPSPIGCELASSQRVGAPVSTSTAFAAPVYPARRAARRISVGKSSSREVGDPPRWVASASFAKTKRPSGSNNNTPSRIDERIVSRIRRSSVDVRSVASRDVRAVMMSSRIRARRLRLVARAVAPAAAAPTAAAAAAIPATSNASAIVAGVYERLPGGSSHVRQRFGEHSVSAPCQPREGSGGDPSVHRPFIEGPRACHVGFLASGGGDPRSEEGEAR